jgi:hypothetical protein
MALEAQNNPFTSLLLVEAADVEALPDADPSAGEQRLAVGTDHLLYLVNSSGTKTQVGGGGGIANPLATDSLWDAAGDLVQATGANTAAKLTAGTAGMFLKSAGAAAANLWAYPPGYEFDYVQKTSNTSVTATTEATGNTVLTSNAVAYDGSTVIVISVNLPLCNPSGSSSLVITLVDGGTAIAELATINTSSGIFIPLFLQMRLTPSNATHTYGVEAYTGAGTATIYAGAGGTATKSPAFIRQTKV